MTEDHIPDDRKKVPAVGAPVQRRVRPLLAPRDWQAMALREAAELTGTTEGAARLAESKRYGALADEIERLRARVLDLEAAHEDASGAILQAVADERERCAHVCRGIAAGHAGTARRLTNDVHSAHASGQRDGANECAAEILKA